MRNRVKLIPGNRNHYQPKKTTRGPETEMREDGQHGLNTSCSRTVQKERAGYRALACIEKGIAKGTKFRLTHADLFHQSSGTQLERFTPFRGILSLG